MIRTANAQLNSPKLLAYIEAQVKMLMKARLVSLICLIEFAKKLKSKSDLATNYRNKGLKQAIDIIKKEVM